MFIGGKITIPKWVVFFFNHIPQHKKWVVKTRPYPERSTLVDLAEEILKQHTPDRSSIIHQLRITRSGLLHLTSAFRISNSWIWSLQQLLAVHRQRLRYRARACGDCVFGFLPGNWLFTSVLGLEASLLDGTN